jgi:hypothetical protein
MTEDDRPKLEAELEAVERALRDALDFLSDDGHLTDKGVAARETLLREITEIKQDLEAVR